jgi:hypothetical protein
MIRLVPHEGSLAPAAAASLPRLQCGRAPRQHGRVHERAHFPRAIQQRGRLHDRRHRPGPLVELDRAVPARL